MDASIASATKAKLSPPLRIAQVAPLWERVPPRKYGGTERVVSVLTEELVRRGHEVTLYASGDSVTSARLKPIVRQALRTDIRCENVLPYQLLQIEQVIKDAAAYDIVHFHEGFLNYSASRRLQRPSLTTMHGRLDLSDFMTLQREFRELALVSISNSQRKPMQWANWIANIYHGYDPSMFTYSAKHANYLAFVGRLSPEKRPDRAIDIAIQAGYPLKIAAKIDVVDREYFHAVVEPLLDNPLIEYIGEVGDYDKQQLLGDALGLLLPIDWPEPFGLTMIEAMACGTPTLAFRAGSVPEVIAHGVSGLIVDTMEEAVEAVEQLHELEREKVRQDFEQRFNAARMVDEYVDVYAVLAGAQQQAMIA